MEMTLEMQQPRKRCSKCSKLKSVDDYEFKKNRGQFMTCITCRRKYYALQDKIMKNEDTTPKKRPRRCLIIDKTLKSLIRSITSLTLKWFKRMAKH